MSAYATTHDLADFLFVEESTLSTDSERLLQRASELVSSMVKRNYDSTVTTHVEAVRNATCAQVEYWQEVGESMDVRGPLQGLIIGKTQYQYGAGNNRITPSYLAPRAHRFLMDAGLLYAGV